MVVGAREPSQIIFGDDLETWADTGAEVAVTVDVSDPGWTGHVGLVTSLLGEAGFDPDRATALVCGPEIMMRFTARTLIDRGVDPGRDPGVPGAQHAVRRGVVRPLSARPLPAVP